jgi:alpha-L-fucosidase
MIKRALTVAIAAAALLALAAPAQAQQYPPDTVFITVSDTTVVPGQPIDISAGLFVPGSPVGFTFFSQPVNLGTATADGDGVATLSVNIPSDATPGTHTITAAGTGIDGAPLSVSTTVTVLADGAAGAGPDGGATGGLPRTGSDPMPIARIAAALLAVGGGLLFITRRRRISSVA